MFDHTSRYYKIKDEEYTTDEGRRILYKCRRILPLGDKIPQLAEVEVTDRERLDVITARTLGDPEQFWRLCDANNAMNPFELTAVSHRKLKVPNPQV